MENDDQRSLAKCITDVADGHEIMDVLNLEQTLIGYKPNKSIAEWRKAALNKHRSWRLDTEMLDLLIGAALHWLEHRSPRSHEKIDPTLYAIIYICGNCENYNIKVSSAENSRFSKIIHAYYVHTDFLDTEKKESKRKNLRTDFKDVIEKAKKIWERDYQGYFTQYVPPTHPTQLELF